MRSRQDVGTPEWHWQAFLFGLVWFFTVFLVGRLVVGEDAGPVVRGGVVVVAFVVSVAARAWFRHRWPRGLGPG